MTYIEKMYLIETGRIIVPDSDPFAKYHTETFKYSIPVPAVLIKHREKGLVLFDTGIEPKHFSESQVSRLIYDEEKRIDHQLEKIGYKAEDVKYVVLSHWHRDHHNQLFLFPNATVYIRDREIVGLHSEPLAGYSPDETQAFERYKEECPNAIIERIPDVEEYDLFGDKSIMLLDTKGHTPGHQSLMVTLKNSGTWIFSADAIHNEWHQKDYNNIQNTWNRTEHINSIKRLEQYQKTFDAKLIFGHDVDQWKQLKLLPEYYD